VSLDTVLRRYVLGSELLRDLIMEEADRGEEHWSPPIPRGALRAVMRAQASVLQRMLAAITVEYRDELEQVGYGSPTGGGSPQLPALLGNPSARRARECLLFLAEQGRLGLSPSNREIAAGIGVTHQPQISRLLAQLAAEGLVSKRSQGAGKRNVLQLTERGEQVVRILLERGPGRMADNP
jgi:DNA-binding transcriptional ArsR family regulator